MNSGNFSAYSFMALLCLTSSSFVIHMYNLVFSNKFKPLNKFLTFFSPCSLYLPAILLHKFQMPQGSWTTVLSTQLSNTTVLCSRPPLYTVVRKVFEDKITVLCQLFDQCPKIVTAYILSGFIIIYGRKVIPAPERKLYLGP